MRLFKTLLNNPVHQDAAEAMGVTKKKFKSLLRGIKKNSPNIYQDFLWVKRLYSRRPKTHYYTSEFILELEEIGHQKSIEKFRDSEKLTVRLEKKTI